jgi:hypothetical protein
VDEVFVKDVERQVESADMDAFDDLFGTDRLVKSKTSEKIDRCAPRLVLEHLSASKIDFLLNHQLLLTLCSASWSNCQELVDWYVSYDSSLKWCNDADDKVSKRSRPGEYIMLVERQHGEIEVNMIWNSFMLFGTIRKHYFNPLY